MEANLGFLLCLFWHEKIALKIIFSILGLLQKNLLTGLLATM